MAFDSHVTSLIRSIASVLSIAAGACVFLLPPPEGLTVHAMRALGITIWAVGWWVTEIIPQYATGLLMCVMWSVVKAVPFAKAFANFSSSSWWIMVGAFGLGAVAGKTGLLKRISFWVLKLLPPTFAGQVLGLMGAGTVIGPLIPSMNAKGALSSPIAMGISDALGLARKSKGACGLFGASFVGFILMGHIFMSGTFTHYLLVGMLPKAYQGITWIDWLLWTLPWGIVVFVGMALALLILYKPEVSSRLPKNYGAELLAKLGPMSRDEKITMVVLLLTLAMWTTEGLHGITAGQVAVIAMCALIGFKVMTRDDFKNGIEWPAVIFVGSILNMATVIQTLKVDVYLGKVLEPVIASVIGNPYLLLLVLPFAVFAVRFIVVNLTSAAVLFALVLIPLMVAMGTHPWIVCFTAFASTNIWFLSYMNSIYLCAHYGTRGELADHGPMVKLSFVYAAVCILGFMVSVPYWKMINLIK